MSSPETSSSSSPPAVEGQRSTHPPMSPSSSAAATTTVTTTGQRVGGKVSGVGSRFPKPLKHNNFMETIKNRNFGGREIDSPTFGDPTSSPLLQSVSQPQSADTSSTTNQKNSSQSSASATTTTTGSSYSTTVVQKSPLKSSSSAAAALQVLVQWLEPTYTFKKGPEYHMNPRSAQQIDVRVTTDGELIAIKKVSSDKPDDCARELRIACMKIHHPNIVRICACRQKNTGYGASVEVHMEYASRLCFYQFCNDVENVLESKRRRRRALLTSSSSSAAASSSSSKNRRSSSGGKNSGSSSTTLRSHLDAIAQLTTDKAPLPGSNNSSSSSTTLTTTVGAAAAGGGGGGGVVGVEDNNSNNSASSSFYENQPPLFQMCEAMLKSVAKQTLLGLVALQCVYDQTIHRDVKHSNILVFPSGLLKLTDYGTAITNPGETSATNRGTNKYKAPEQFSGRQIDKSKIDCWGLGITLLYAKLQFMYGLEGEAGGRWPQWAYNLQAKLNTRPQNQEEYETFKKKDHGMASLQRHLDAAIKHLFVDVGLQKLVWILLRCDIEKRASVKNALAWCFALTPNACKILQLAAISSIEGKTDEGKAATEDKTTIRPNSNTNSFVPSIPMSISTTNATTTSTNNNNKPSSFHLSSSVSDLQLHNTQLVPSFGWTPLISQQRNFAAENALKDRHGIQTCDSTIELECEAVSRLLNQHALHLASSSSSSSIESTSAATAAAAAGGAGLSHQHSSSSASPTPTTGNTPMKSSANSKLQQQQSQPQTQHRPLISVASLGSASSSSSPNSPNRNNNNTSSSSSSSNIIITVERLMQQLQDSVNSIEHALECELRHLSQLQERMTANEFVPVQLLLNEVLIRREIEQVEVMREIICMVPKSS